MTRLLITGGTGFIGQHVVKAFVEAGFDVVLLVRASSSYRHVDRTAQIIEGDIRNLATVKSAMLGCEAVVHVAGLYSFNQSAAATAYDVNVNGTANVIQAATQLGINRLVYTSTVGTTAFHPTRLATEADIAEPASMCGPYKRSKFEAERLARHAAAKGVPIVIVCPTAPIGPGDAKPTPTGKLILDFLLRKLPAYVDTGLNFVHVKDVAIGHVLALNHGTPGHRYLLGNIDGNLTMAQALGQLALATGLAPPRLRIPWAIAIAMAQADNFVEGTLLRREPKIPLEGVRMARTPMWVDPSKSVHELGLPQTPLATAFRDAADWFVKRSYANAPPRLR